jgi:hypothetical protein
LLLKIDSEGHITIGLFTETVKLNITVGFIAKTGSDVSSNSAFACMHATIDAVMHAALPVIGYV